MNALPQVGIDRPQLAVVGFCGRSDLRWLRFLKPGFRHCLVLLCDGRGWILCDPLAHATEIAVLPAGLDPMAWLLAQGVLPVPTRVQPPRRRPRMPAPFTCVEAVKRLLGLRVPRVVTPWQLFRHLVTAQHKILDGNLK